MEKLEKDKNGKSFFFHLTEKNIDIDYKIDKENISVGFNFLGISKRMRYNLKLSLFSGNR